MNAVRAELLLTRFARVPRVPPRRPTLMEIAGRPNLENVISNLFAFYLDPTSPHGLGSIALEALVEAANLNGVDVQSVEQVKREYVTDARKRIDVAVITPDNILAIECKVYAGLCNDLDHYVEHLTGRYEGRIVQGIVLSLHETTADSQTDYRTVTYSTLFREILSRPGHCLFQSREPYITGLVDLAETIARFTEKQTMDESIRDFFVKYENDANELINAYMDFASEMKNRLHNVADLVQIPTHLRSMTHRRFYHDQTRPLERYYVFEFAPAVHVLLALDIYLSPAGWTLSVNAKKGRPQVKAWLAISGIETTNSLKDSTRFVLAEKIPFDTPEAEIAERVNGFLSLLVEYEEVVEEA